LQYDSQRFYQNQNSNNSDGEIEQYYGKGNVFEQQKASGGSVTTRIHQKPKEPFSWLSKLDGFPIQKNNGFLAYFIFIIIQTLILLLQMKWGSVINGVALAIASFLLWKRVNFTLPDTIAHYLSNATVTLKALLKQLPLLNRMLDNSRQILIGSILLLSAHILLLEHILPTTMTIIGHSLSSYGVLLGLVLSFANREYRFMNQSMTLFVMILAGEVGLYVVLYEYLHVFSGTTILLVWAISSWLKEWDKLTVVDEKNRKDKEK